MFNEDGDDLASRSGFAPDDIVVNDD